MFARLWKIFDTLNTQLEDLHWSIQYTPRCLHCVKSDIHGRYCFETRKNEITVILCTPANARLLVREYASRLKGNPQGSSFDMTQPVLDILAKAKVFKPGKPQAPEQCIAATCAEILGRVFNNRELHVDYMEVSGNLWERRGKDPHIRHDIRFRILA